MKQEDKRGLKNKVGAYGEEIAAQYVINHQQEILERNYLKKWGEIDIVSRETTDNKQIIHFVEVKTVSYETKSELQKAVSYGTWRPEENVNPAKLKKMHRAIESWLMENNIDAEWQVDVIAVRIVPREKYATIKCIPNVI